MTPRADPMLCLSIALDVVISSQNSPPPKAKRTDRVGLIVAFRFWEITRRIVLMGISVDMFIQGHASGKAIKCPSFMSLECMHLVLAIINEPPGINMPL